MYSERKGIQQPTCLRDVRHPDYLSTHEATRAVRAPIVCHSTAVGSFRFGEVIVCWVDGDLRLCSAFPGRLCTVRSNPISRFRWHQGSSCSGGTFSVFDFRNRVLQRWWRLGCHRWMSVAPQRSRRVGSSSALLRGGGRAAFSPQVAFIRGCTLLRCRCVQSRKRLSRMALQRRCFLVDDPFSAGLALPFASGDKS